MRLINRDVSLTTDVFFYDLAQDVGYYETGGTLSDKQNTLNSLQGFYYPATKDAFFYLNVDLMGPRQNDTLRMYTDSLTYNTDTRVAQLMCPTLIINKDGEITSSSGFYDTNTGVAGQPPPPGHEAQAKGLRAHDAPAPRHHPHH